MALKVLTWFLAPLIILLSVAIPLFPSPSPSHDVAPLLQTLWQVQAAVATVAIVIFVFLLQTADLRKRTFSSVLNLALEAGILSAAALGLSIVCGIGIALLVAQTIGAMTWPVIAAIIVALIVNVVSILTVLIRSLGYLANSKMEELERKTLLSQVHESTVTEIQDRASLNWLSKNLEGSTISSLFDFQHDVTGWSLIEKEGKEIADIDLRKLDRIGVQLQSDLRTDKPVMKLIGRLMWSPRKAEDAFIVIAGTPRKGIKRKIDRCFRWRKVSDTNSHDMIDGSMDELLASVNSSDISGFKKGITRSEEIIEATLQKMADYGLASDSGITEIYPFEKVLRTLRFALEEALKTKRANFAFAAGRDLTNLAEVAFKYGNRTAFERILMMYPFLRKVIFNLNAYEDPIYQDLYWRSIHELAMMLPSLAKDLDQDAVPMGLGVIENVFLAMFSDSIMEGGKDFGNVLEGWDQTLGEETSVRMVINRKGKSNLKDPDSKAHWMLLLGWATYLAIEGQLKPDDFASIFQQLAAKFRYLEEAVVSASSAMDREDTERDILSSWILWSKPTGHTYGIDSRSPISHALILLLLAWANKPLQAKSYVPDSDSLEVAAMAADAKSTIDLLNDPTSPLAQLAASAGIWSEKSPQVLKDLSNAFSGAVKIKDERKKEELRRTPLDAAAIHKFVEITQTEFDEDSFFSRARNAARVSEDLLPAEPDALCIGVNELVDKAFFTKGGYGPEMLAMNAAERLVRGEKRSCLEKIAETAVVRRSVPVERLLEELVRLCKRRKSGCIVVQGAATRLDLYRHPEFRYPEENRNGDLIGTLAGVPVYYGFDIKGFAALYLPDNSVEVTYAKIREGETHKVGVVVQEITAQLAAQLVADLEASGKETFDDPEDRERKILRYLELVNVRVHVRPIVTANGAHAFTTRVDLDEENIGE